jgi:hypothetical protein
MKRFSILPCLLVILLFIQQEQASAQVQDSLKHKIAVFCPLYLDSAFTPYDTAARYLYGKTEFPKFINPGLEFYEGAKLALDSLNHESAPLEIYIYDTRSSTESMQKQLSRPEMDSMELIIANCTSSEEKILADEALKKNIPVINATIPNDGNVSGNPFLVILNSTLRTQCEGIFKFIRKYYPLNPVVLFRKRGNMEDRIKTYFDDYNKSTSSLPVKFRYVNLPDSFSVSELKPWLDSTQQTVCIAGSLDENFARMLTKNLTLAAKKYPSSLIGMPTWDNIKDFKKNDFKSVDIIYGTPFYNPKTDNVSQEIINYYNKEMYMRPSDMVFRGYEVTMKFARLLLKYGKDIASNLSTRQQKIFSEFDIQPVLNRQTMTLDYFENKKIYFLKYKDGALISVY